VAALALTAPAGALAAAGTLIQTGGDAAPGSPKIAAASCANQRAWTCARGQVLTIAGDELEGVRAVVFLGGRGRRDNVRVRVHRRMAARGELLTVVPRRARSGRVRVIGMIGRPAVSAAPLHVLAELPAIDDAGRLNKLVAGGRREAHVAYRVNGTPAPDAVIEAVRLPQGTVVKTWPLVATPDGAATVSWDGFDGEDAAPTGTYLLRLNAAAAGAATLDEGSDTQFDLLQALFPIRGRHRIGRSVTQRFGGPRGHQGQDTFARCGTPLAALTKGVVQYAGYQGAAGNYVVVRRPDGESYAYMHLREAPAVERGDRIFTGQRLGHVGQTGHADGCHLHLELWTAPGWYAGGHPYDPAGALERWDAWS
jgi:murein DD-endopeptidase MepM/ murein hydrolase activator NlpD